MCYLMPRGAAVIWAGLTLGRSWRFTVCQPGLGIAPRLGLGGLGNEQEGRTEWGREGSERGWREGSNKWDVGDKFQYRVKLWRGIKRRGTERQKTQIKSPVMTK